MSKIIARIDQNQNFLIKGEVNKGNDFLEIDKEGNLFVNKLYNGSYGFNDLDNVDDEYAIEEDLNVDTEDELAFFIATIFGVDTVFIGATRVRFEGINVVAPKAIENQILEGE